MSHDKTTDADAGVHTGDTWHHIAAWTADPANPATSEDIRREDPVRLVERELIPIYGALTPINTKDEFSLISPANLVDGGNRRLIVSRVPDTENGGTRLRVHGSATDNYHIWQPGEAVDWLDSLVSEGQMLYESAFGQFDGNEEVFVCRLPSAFTLGKKDQTLAYLLVIVPFTGNKSIRILPTEVRVVCGNTKRAALSRVITRGKRKGEKERVALDFRLRHSGSLADRLAVAHKALATMETAFAASAANAERLASFAMTQDTTAAFIAEMFPTVDADGIALEKGKKTNREIRVRVLRQAWKTERESFRQMGDDSMIGSAWHLLNALTRAADHGAKVDVPDGKTGKTRTTEVRGLEGRKGSTQKRLDGHFASASGGALANLKTSAETLLLQMAGAF